MSNIFDGLGDDDEIVKVETRELVVKAPFGYPGGKGRSLTEILPRLPKTEKYIEVFGGSGAVLINRPTSKFEVFNDRFSAVVDFYKCLRDKDSMERLIELLELYVFSREDFLECRDTWVKVSDPVERAAKWYYMHQNSFTNHGRNFARALKGVTGNKIFTHFPLFQVIHKRVKNVMFENLDWRICLDDFDDSDAVFYLDPPYMHETISGAKMYEHTLTKSDHRTLCDKVFSMKGFVALSGYNNEIYTSYPWTAIYNWDVRVSADPLVFNDQNHRKNMEFTSGRGTAREFLFVKEA